MNLLPQFELSISNASWFSILFIATNIIVLETYPSHYKKRVLDMPKFDNVIHQIIGLFNYILFQGLIIAVVFMPINFEVPFFFIGAGLFIIGYLAYIISILNYASSNPNKPVIKGIYRFSRNPQQLSTIVMWIGLGFLTTCWLIIIVCLIQLVAAFLTFIAQEKHCIDKYGDEYKMYMESTSRYIGFNLKKIRN